MKIGKFDVILTIWIVTFINWMKEHFLTSLLQKERVYPIFPQSADTLYVKAHLLLELQIVYCHF